MLGLVGVGWQVSLSTASLLSGSILIAYVESVALLILCPFERSLYDGGIVVAPPNDIQETMRSPYKYSIIPKVVGVFNGCMCASMRDTSTVLVTQTESHDLTPRPLMGYFSGICRPRGDNEPHPQFLPSGDR